MNLNSIDDLKLSVRAYNCLKNAGVKTIEDMALIDLYSLKNCGRKTIDEINDKIEELILEGRYSQDFINQNFPDSNRSFLNQLPLSVRATNILRLLSVNNENDLLHLDYEKLKNTRNAGRKTIEEIIDYIEKNKNKLEEEAAFNGTIHFDISINNIPNFCGTTLITELPLNSNLKNALNNNNIITILDLLLNKMQFEDSIMPLYNAVYEYFHNMAYGPLTLSVSPDLADLYINLPFSMLNLKENYYIKIHDLIEYIIDNFGNLELEDKLNSKLFLYWINSFDIVDKKQYFIDKLMLKDKEYEILSLRGTRTLEEVGQLFGVTRERIRQIEAKVVNKINKNYKLIPFKFIDNKKIYYVNDLDDFYSLLLYIDTIKDEKSHIFIKDDINSYYLPVFYINKMEKFVHNNISQFENQGFLEIDLSEWNDNDILIRVLDYLNLNLYGNKISKKLTKRLQVKYAMKYINRPISISSIDDQTEIVRIVKSIFGNDLEVGRGMEALIADAGVRVDSGKYATSDNIDPLSKELLSKIVKYVKDRKIINTRDLFIVFGEELTEHNLNNETILYRYLKETLSNELFFHGVSAVISGDPELAGWGDLAIRIMKENHQPISKLSFMVKYSLTDPVYNQLPLYYDDIIIWSSKELYLKSLLDIPSNIKDELIKILKIAQIVRFDEVRKIINTLDVNLMKLNNVKTNDNLYNFLINILPECFEISKKNEEVKYINSFKTIIEEVYDETEELTL